MDDSKLHQLTRYIARGWALVPLHHVDPVTGLCTCTGTKADCGQRSAGKHPRRARWQEGANLVTHPDMLARLHEQHPDWNWGVATGPVSGVWVLDIDDLDAWARLLATVDARPEHLQTFTQRTGGGGLQLVYRLPADFVPNNSSGRLPAGIDVRGARRGEAAGGQIVIAPSVSGKGAYEVLADVEPIDAPGWLLEPIRPAPPRERGAPTPAGPPASGLPSAGSHAARYAMAAVQRECRELESTPTGRNNRAYAAAARVIELCNAPWSGLTLEDGYDAWAAATFAHPLGIEVPAREVDSVWRSALRQVGDREADPPAPLAPMTGGDHLPLPPGPTVSSAPTGAVLSPPQPSAGAQGGPVPTPSALCLPEAFWAARPVLQHIRRAAHSRLVSADVVLYGVLTRLAACWPHQVPFDTGVKGPVLPNLFAAVVGPAGSGKTSGVSAARRMLERPPWLPAEQFADDLPLGTGEGIAESYMGQVARPVTDEHGVAVQNKDGSVKLEKVRSQVRHNALLYADEGEILARLLERSGATVGETIRRAWIGATLGQANGRAETTRIVREGTYALGLVIGFQPTTCQALLADVDAGTPQRFLWAWSIDPSIPEHDVEHPGPLTGVWQAPTAGVELPGTGWLMSDGGGGSDVDTRSVSFPATVRAFFRGLERDRAHGRYTPAPQDSHLHLMRAKVAVLLAGLEGRRDVTEEDWALAGMVVETSCRVRDHCIALGEQQQGKDRAARIAAHAAQEHAAEHARGAARDERETATVERVAKRISAKVIEAGAAGVARGTMRNQLIARRDRVHFDDALSCAVEHGTVRIDGDRLYPGGWAVVG